MIKLRYKDICAMGSYTWYFKLSDEIGLKIFRKYLGNGYTRGSNPFTEIELMNKARLLYKFVPKVYGVVEASFRGRKYYAMIVQHIDGNESDLDISEQGLLIPSFYRDYHGSNVIEDKDGNLWLIDFTPKYIDDTYLTPRQKDGILGE